MGYEISGTGRVYDVHGAWERNASVPEHGHRVGLVGRRNLLIGHAVVHRDPAPSTAILLSPGHAPHPRGESQKEGRALGSAQARPRQMTVSLPASSHCVVFPVLDRPDDGTVLGGQ